MNKKTLAAILIAIAMIALTLKQCNQTSNFRNSSATNSTDELNRNPSHINYSNHARCRMGCRHVDETEVTELLHEGKINYLKSELKTDNCHKKYAVEGYSHDSQHLRIIFALCNSEVTVVTVIDLNREWPCDCE